MNPMVGWALAAAAVVGGWFSYGWPGLALAGTCIVFWLLLQFSRTMRVLRQASQRPVGSVDSAVMLASRLHKGMSLMEVLPLTKALGRKLPDADDAWAWADDGGAEVQAVFEAGKLVRWELKRTQQEAAAAP